MRRHSLGWYTAVASHQNARTFHQLVRCCFIRGNCVYELPMVMNATKRTLTVKFPCGCVPVVFLFMNIEHTKLSHPCPDFTPQHRWSTSGHLTSLDVFACPAFAFQASFNFSWCLCRPHAGLTAALFAVQRASIAVEQMTSKEKLSEICPLSPISANRNDDHKDKL